jgi:hypothetical protein
LIPAVRSSSSAVRCGCGRRRRECYAVRLRFRVGDELSKRLVRRVGFDDQKQRNQQCDGTQILVRVIAELAEHDFGGFIGRCRVNETCSRPNRRAAAVCNRRACTRLVFDKEFPAILPSKYSARYAGKCRWSRRRHRSKSTAPDRSKTPRRSDPTSLPPPRYRPAQPFASSSCPPRPRPRHRSVLFHSRADRNKRKVRPRNLVAR